MFGLPGLVNVYITKWKITILNDMVKARFKHYPETLIFPGKRSFHGISSLIAERLGRSHSPSQLNHQTSEPKARVSRQHKLCRTRWAAHASAACALKDKPSELFQISLAIPGLLVAIWHLLHLVAHLVAPHLIHPLAIHVVSTSIALPAAGGTRRKLPHLFTCQDVKIVRGQI